jgi:uncharacterized membrane protein YidH (DUF202 family)
MNVLGILLALVGVCVLALGAINFYLLRIIHKLEAEVDSLQTPF